MDDPSLHIPLCPVGTWSGELIKIAYSDKDQDGNQRVYESGDEYFMVRLIVRPREPQEDVDKRAAKEFIAADGPNETVLSHTRFVSTKRQVSNLTRLLTSLGVPVAGRTIKALSEEYRGGVPCLFEVEHGEDRNGEPREDVSAIFPNE